MLLSFSPSSSPAPFCSSSLVVALGQLHLMTGLPPRWLGQTLFQRSSGSGTTTTLIPLDGLRRLSASQVHNRDFPGRG